MFKLLKVYLNMPSGVFLYKKSAIMENNQEDRAVMRNCRRKRIMVRKVIKVLESLPEERR
jgi:hypothetical protein